MNLKLKTFCLMISVVSSASSAESWSNVNDSSLQSLQPTLKVLKDTSEKAVKLDNVQIELDKRLSVIDGKTSRDLKMTGGSQTVMSQLESVSSISSRALSAANSAQSRANHAVNVGNSAQSRANSAYSRAGSAGYIQERYCNRWQGRGDRCIGWAWRTASLRIIK